MESVLGMLNSAINRQIYNVCDNLWATSDLFVCLLPPPWATEILFPCFEGCSLSLNLVGLWVFRESEIIQPVIVDGLIGLLSVGNKVSTADSTSLYRITIIHTWITSGLDYRKAPSTTVSLPLLSNLGALLSANLQYSHKYSNTTLSLFKSVVLEK